MSQTGAPQGDDGLSSESASVSDADGEPMQAGAKRREARAANPTRRAFLKASGAVGLGSLSRGGDEGEVGLTATDVPTPDDLPNPSLSQRAGNFERAGYPSRSAYQDIATQERLTLQQQGPFNPAQEVDAVAYLGLDSGEPVDTALGDAAAAGRLDDTLLRFPSGEYRIAGGRTNLFVEGAFGIVGSNTRFVLDEGVHAALQFIGSRIRIDGITIDQSAPGAVASVLLRPENGTIEWVNVTRVGVVSERTLQDHAGKPQIQLRIDGNGESYVRVENYRALGGGNAGAHSWANSCTPPEGFVAPGNGAPGIWAGIGTSPGTTIQIINPELHGWENGIYASRTPSPVQVIGGKFVNNNNASIRIAGEDSYANGCSIYFNQEEYPLDQMPGPYRPGEIQGLNGVRSEGRGTQAAATLENLDLQAYNVQRLDDYRCGGVNGLIRIQGTVGRGLIDNCRLRYQSITDTPAILANYPDGNGYYPAPPGPHDIQIRNVEIEGDQMDSAAVDVRGRPNSMILDSCIRTPRASPDEIDGARAQNVGYGPNCTESQLVTGPVGAPGNLSAMNLSAPTGNFSFVSSRRGQRRGAATVISAVVALILGVMGLVSVGGFILLLALCFVLLLSAMLRV
ncbi:hypothetical protein [Halococcus sp. AFM35]|uniref:hypothetical protein n=1 Tax=Halococcus sp. AFM35 TaxID=3421653 RepID=UPI003EB7766D